MALGMAPVARGQYDDEGGTITLKDFGSGGLVVRYLNEQSASGAAGCFHVEVMCPSGPSPRDRNLELVFYTNSLHSGSDGSTAYRFPVRLPEGAGRAVASLPYVSTGLGNRSGNQALASIWDVSVFEDGHDVEAMRTYSGSRGRGAGTTVQPGNRDAYHVTASTGASWSMLRIVDDTLAASSLQPEMFRLVSATDRDQNRALTQSLVSKTDMGLSRDWQNVSNIRGLGSAPEQWLYYLQFNYVVIDESVLAQIRSARPRLSEALKQYVAAGGSLLLLSGEQPGQELIDQWLSEAADSPSAVRGDWLTITAPMENWWNRAARLVPVGAGDPLQSGNLGMQTMQTPMATTTTYGYVAPGTAVPYPQTTMRAPTAPAAPPPTPPGTVPTQTQLPASEGLYRVAPPPPTGEPAALTVGGCARDMLTALETYSMAEFRTPLVVVDKLVEVTMGNGASMATYGGVPQNLSGIPFDMIDVFEPLRASLEQAVVDIQEKEVAGCSLREYALGNIGVVQSGLNAQTQEALEQLLATLSSSAAVRVNSVEDNAWSWRNLITSVGKPPVWTFCAFVLLFGLLLGPGLLILTGWMGRRSLLIFLVPCISLVATLSIAAFEILHEGFGTSIRINSVLAIDAPSGQSFAWSRQTYFSGWPPRGGLEFPRDVYFRSVNEYPSGYRYALEEPQHSVRNRVDVAEDGARWTGWLSPREQQQLLIGHPAKVTVPLQATRVDRQHVKIKNLTTDSLPFAAVRDDGDSYYLALDLMPGAEIEATAQTAYEVGIELTRIRAKHIPTAPMEMQAGGGWWSRRYVGYMTDASLNEVLDSAWHRYVSEYLRLPRQGFVTLQENTEAIYVPLKGQVTESKQLVVGRLEW